MEPMSDDQDNAEFTGNVVALVRAIIFFQAQSKRRWNLRKLTIADLQSIMT
jgi:hypothetical protein